VWAGDAQASFGGDFRTMLKLNVTTRKGETHILDATIGMSLMEVVRDAGIGEMLALCGGVCSCATCHVHIDSEFADMLPPMSEDEDGLLDGSSHRNARSRLACQIRMNEGLSGLHLTIAEED
jgi:ferredoxin, 2Fe-2S